MILNDWRWRSRSACCWRRGKDGQEVIFYLRSKFPTIPIIVLTGKPDVPDIIRSFDEGVVDFLVKPVHPDNLLAAVAKAVQGRGRSPSK